MTLPTYRAEHIVQGEPLMIHALEDFVGELTRQRPWLKARYEEALEAVDDLLSADTPATLSAYLSTDPAALLAALPGQELLAEALGAFNDYLREWHWV
ncbi:hypothetical protein GCM10017783_12310 [Deinococcus piscis]|uniref:Uncharacterized protein n=1 Tax=Deinococcus piscis TaxID=394230 RepID=A0ABQ3K3K4_9DEIO|nr:hypothetical protein [Deinococcus piscis]GHG01609.1 hypothetical protein GCM10017783_12310 [Deinococcus piscis]